MCEWLAWLLRIKRPGKPSQMTRKKSFVKTNKMRDLELRERSSKSLLANVLDLDDDFRAGATANNTSNHHNSNFSRHGSSIHRHNDSEYMGSHDYRMAGHNNDFRSNNAPPSYGLVANSDPSEENTALKQILKELRFLSAKKREEDEFQEVCNDWKYAAIVIDRLCLWMFTIFTIVSTFAILFSAPNILA